MLCCVCSEIVFAFSLYEMLLGLGYSANYLTRVGSFNGSHSSQSVLFNGYKTLRYVLLKILSEKNIKIYCVCVFESDLILYILLKNIYFDN